ncbi:MAG: GMC family oxidoreductase [Pseudomonadota bacterium]
MIIDLTKEDAPREQRTQVCIIGAGVAGQAVAMRLADKGVDVLLLESGGPEFDAEHQAMAKGDNVGEEYYDLDTTRLRLFGGTAAIWGGRCAELDEIDFTQRDYLPHSGWPITKQDLAPYYEHAFRQMGLERPAGDRLWSIVGRDKPAFDPTKLDAGLWCFDENGERFTDTNRGSLGKVSILLGATVTRIDVGEQGDVRGIVAQSLSGRTVEVQADHFVLAAGALESVRLLFAAVPERPQGFGNDRDQLGRYFMEHPHARGGQILPTNLAQSILVLPRALRVQGKRYAAYLRPADKLQQSLGILNTSISFAARRHEGMQMDALSAATGKLKHDLPSTRFWRSLYKGLKGAAIRLLEVSDPWPTMFSLKRGYEKKGLYAVVRAEQAPIAESRVTLGADADALGLRRPVLDWQFSEIDRRSVRVLMETLKAEYQRLGWGDVALASWLHEEGTAWKTDPLISAHPIGGYHHMGGTRMGEALASSVVDADCKLHESPNLYVASSSVFPTGGWANPTMTIIALAERLGDHLTAKTT